jgi:ParB/RepB/Spo0J family partition protein
MSKNKLFGGLNLGNIAQSVVERGEPSPMAGSAVRPVVPAAELALTGRVGPGLERENIFLVDAKRCRPWKFHDRAASWYTRERCADLIESLPRLGQQEPAVARKLVDDPDFDYELISGMRRRFACEHLGMRLKLRVVQVDDAKAAVLMHAENADRQDITPMERAVAFQRHLEAGLFASQDALAEAMSVSKGQVAKMLKAASLLRMGPLEGLFRDVAAVPVDPAYKLATLMERPGAGAGQEGRGGACHGDPGLAAVAGCVEAGGACATRVCGGAGQAGGGAQCTWQGDADAGQGDGGRGSHRAGRGTGARGSGAVKGGLFHVNLPMVS